MRSARKLVIMILHSVLAVAFCALPVAAPACSVPASAFKLLHEGMTYNEVAAVMGCDGAHKSYRSDAAPDTAHPSGTVTIDEYSWGGAEAGAGFVMADFYDGKLHDWKGMPPRH
jgi:hypothetical protein